MLSIPADVAVGACCVDGQCQDNSGAGIEQDTCEQTLGGVFQGDGTDCETTSCNAIPTVSEWGLIVMALLMLAAGTIVHRLRPKCGLPS